MFNLRLGRARYDVEEALKIGPGGYITDIDIALDGAQVCRTDTYGGYVRDSSSDVWRQVLTIESMPSGTAGLNGSGDLIGSAPTLAVYDITLAPSDSSRGYMVWGKTVFKSTDRCATWASTGFTPFTTDEDFNTRASGKRIAVKPDDPDTVIVCTPDGTYRTTNGGTSWTEITDLATPTSAAGGVVAFDPSSTSVVYVGISGVGMYRSTNAGANFTAMTGDPTTMRRIAVGSDGVVMLTTQSTGANLWRYKSGSWSNLAAAASGSNSLWHSVTPVPASAGHWYFAGDAGLIAYSSNDGDTVTGQFAGTRVADTPEATWLEVTEETYMSNGNMVFDPSQSNLLLFAHGIGVAKGTPPTSATSFDWNYSSRGIEQLVTTWIDVPPGGTPIISCWDRPIFKLASDNSSFPASHGVNYDYSIRHGWSWDWAKDDPTFIVVCATRHIAGSGGMPSFPDIAQIGYSDDGGATWAEATGTPDTDIVAGGSIAAATSTNWLWCNHGHEARIRYTNDGGDTWGFSTLSGIPTSGSAGWESGFGVVNGAHRRSLCCDDNGYFYVYTNGVTGDASSAGVWKSNSANNGSAFTKVYNGVLPTSASPDLAAGFNAYNAVLSVMPGAPDFLFFTGGDVGGSVSGAFLRSDDGGVSWDAIPDVIEVQAFGYGRSANGTDDPALHIVGWVDGDYGLWVSENATAANVADITWSKKSTYPLGRVDVVTTVSGNINAYGVSYVGYRGSGAVRVVWA
jgi:hypothetical protein